MMYLRYLIPPLFSEHAVAMLVITEVPAVLEALGSSSWTQQLEQLPSASGSMEKVPVDRPLKSDPIGDPYVFHIYSRSTACLPVYSLKGPRARLEGSHPKLLAA